MAVTTDSLFSMALKWIKSLSLKRAYCLAPMLRKQVCETKKHFVYECYVARIQWTKDCRRLDRTCCTLTSLHPVSNWGKLNKKHVGTRATSVQTLVSPMLHQQTSCTAHNPWPIAWNYALLLAIYKYATRLHVPSRWNGLCSEIPTISMGFLKPSLPLFVRSLLPNLSSLDWQIPDKEERLPRKDSSLECKGSFFEAKTQRSLWIPSTDVM